MPNGVKAVLKFIAEVIVVLGAAACILQWLGIQPKDLKVATLGPGAMVLFASSIGSSTYSLYRNTARDKQGENQERATLQHVHDEEVRRLEATHESELSRCLAITEQLKAEKREALDRLHNLEEKIANDPATGLLTPLQVEILRLRRSIVEWFSDLPECPVMDMTDLEGDNADRRTAAHNRKISEWSERIRHAYAIEFAPKVLEVVHKLGLDGVDVRSLEARSSSVGTPDEASEIIIELGDMALQAEGNR